MNEFRQNPDLREAERTGEPQVRSLSRRNLLLGCAAFFVVGVAAMIYLQGDGLTSPSRYHGDLTQSPHWVAYHGDRFASDDLLVEYGTYNETVVQNAIYWIGTWFIDVVLLNKIVGITIFGLTSALFFWLVSSMSGPRVGVVASLFFVIFPRSAYEIAGGFSKAWALGFLLIAVYVVETRRWRVLLWVMPLAALAYPMSAVQIGAVVSIGILLEFPRATGEAFRGLKHLVFGSVLALGPLLYKYLTPPDRIGEMISTERMRELWALGVNTTVTIPLWEDVLDYIEHPFFIYGVVLVSMFLYRRGIVWKRSWTALVVASAISYYVSDLVIPRLYLPDRYSRYSIALLLILWFAQNWTRAVEVFKRTRLRNAAVAAIVAFAFVSFSETFKPCDGEKSQGVWEDYDEFAPMSRVMAREPSPVLVAGHPYETSQVMVQARQPVLVIHRMFHPWFAGYSEEIDQRIRNTFRAIYAETAAEVNAFAERYGITHLIVRKRDFAESKLKSGNIYRPQFRNLVLELAADSHRFVLRPPPAGSVIYEDGLRWIVRLPLEERGVPGDASDRASPGG